MSDVDVPHLQQISPATLFFWFKVLGNPASASQHRVAKRWGRLVMKENLGYRKEKTSHNCSRQPRGGQIKEETGDFRNGRKDKRGWLDCAGL